MSCQGSSPSEPKRQTPPWRPILRPTNRVEWAGEHVRISLLPTSNSGRLGLLLPPGYDNPIVHRISAEVEAQNALARATAIEGCGVPVWHRQFVGAIGLGGGRWTAKGSESYQSLPKADRLRLRINGEPVAEIDIRAAHLCLLHGLMRLPMPQGDPYGFDPAIPRQVIRAWIVAALSTGMPPRRWPSSIKRELPELSEYPLTTVTKAAIARYPFLAEPWRAIASLSHIAPPNLLLTHRLTAIEAEIISRTLAVLRVSGILGLPTGDGVIVALSAVPAAIAALRAAGERIAGVTVPLAVVRHGEPEEYVGGTA